MPALESVPPPSSIISQPADVAGMVSRLAEPTVAAGIVFCGIVFSAVVGAVVGAGVVGAAVTGC
jgi:hypothetical protein